MTHQELTRHFRNSLTQYLTIDRAKSEHFGKLIQGFVAFKVDDTAHIVPFHFHRNHPKEVVSELVKMAKDKFPKAELAGISLVQHYIHYTVPTNTSPIITP